MSDENKCDLSEAEKAVLKVAEAYASNEKASAEGIARVYELVLTKVREMHRGLEK